MTSGTDPVRLDGRVALVTGASGDIGRAIVCALGQRGAKVVSGDLTSVGTEADSEWLRLDVTDEDWIRSALHTVRRRHGAP